MIYGAAPTHTLMRTTVFTELLAESYRRVGGALMSGQCRWVTRQAEVDAGYCLDAIDHIAGGACQSTPAAFFLTGLFEASQIICSREGDQ